MDGRDGGRIDPTLFAHGRLLRRYDGSDVCRFSTRAAVNILSHIDTASCEGPHVLWDPFCGTGLIPCVALAAFRGVFDAVIASDIDPRAVACARNNIGLFTDPAALDVRVRELQVLARTSPKAQARWGPVARYAEEFRPHVRGASRVVTRALVASALALPMDVPGRVHFVADLPYGRMCRLSCGVIEDIIPSVLRAYPDADVTFVLPREDVARAIARVVRPVRVRDLKNARAILRA